jgi:urea transport system permease protein
MAPPVPAGKSRMRFMISCLLAIWALCLAAPAHAETATGILAANRTLVKKASRQTIGAMIDALAASDDPAAANLLAA